MGGRARAAIAGAGGRARPDGSLGDRPGRDPEATRGSACASVCILKHRAELRLAALWYEERRERFGDEFIAAMGAMLERIGTSPEAFPLWPGVRQRRAPIRRAVVARFPYVIAFEQHDDVVHVLGIALAKRRPLLVSRWQVCRESFKSPLSPCGTRKVLDNLCSWQRWRVGGRRSWNSGLALLVGGITAASAARIASVLDARHVGAPTLSSDTGSGVGGLPKTPPSLAEACEWEIGSEQSSVSQPGSTDLLPFSAHQ